MIEFIKELNFINKNSRFKINQIMIIMNKKQKNYKIYNVIK